MTIDPISMVERAIRETERKVEREIAKWLRRRASSPEGVHARVALERAADLIDDGDYKK